MTDRDAMKAALEAFDHIWKTCAGGKHYRAEIVGKAIAALRERLAQADEPEPVGWMPRRGLESLVAGSGPIGVWPLRHQLGDDAAPVFASPPPRSPSAALSVVLEQAEDEGLWFSAQTASEAYLQQELRRLHAAVESEPRPEAPHEPR